MALITRVALACNKCGKEFYNVKANLSVMAEDFYLCDKCMEGLLDYLSAKTTKDETVEKPTLTYMKWDDYTLGKLVDYHRANLTQKQIAEKFAVKLVSIQNIITRIRQSEPGSTLYQYRKYFVEED